MKQIAAMELKQKLAQNAGLFLLDVREKHEHDAGNIGGVLIPLGEVMQQLKNIPKHEPVIVYCKKGIRSQVAIQRLEQKGFTNLFNLTGGIDAYNKLKF